MKRMTQKEFVGLTMSEVNRKLREPTVRSVGEGPKKRVPRFGELTEVTERHDSPEGAAVYYLPLCPTDYYQVGYWVSPGAPGQVTRLVFRPSQGYEKWRIDTGCLREFWEELGIQGSSLDIKLPVMTVKGDFLKARAPFEVFREMVLPKLIRLESGVSRTEELVQSGRLMEYWKDLRVTETWELERDRVTGSLSDIESGNGLLSALVTEGVTERQAVLALKLEAGYYPEMRGALDRWPSGTGVDLAEAVGTIEQGLDHERKLREHVERALTDIVAETIRVTERESLASGGAVSGEEIRSRLYIGEKKFLDLTGGLYD